MKESDLKDLYWGLLSRADLRQVSGLNFDQVKFVVSLIPKDELDKWLAWHEGLDKWQPLKSFKILFAESGPRTYSPPIPPAEPMDLMDSDSMSTRAKMVDRRVNKRFLKEFRVEIKGPHGGIFKTVTVNLSSGGMLLADTIPAEFGKNFSCRLTRDDGNSLDLYGALVKSPPGDARSRVKFLDISQPKVLNAWLVDPKTT